MVKERYHALDLLKTLAILMVCAYHFPAVGNATTATLVINAIASICVPMFFFVNGALLFSKEYDTMAHMEKCAKILVQFFVWKFITLLVIAGIYQINLIQVGWIHIVNVVFFFGNITDINMAHLWFIPVLLSLYLLFPFFKALFDRLDQRANLVFYLVFVGALILVSMLCNDGEVYKCFVPYVKVLNIAGLANFSPFQGLIAAMLAYFLLGGLLQRFLPTLKKIKTGYLLLLYALGLASLLGQYYITTIYLALPIYDITFTGYNTAATACMVCSLFLLTNKIPDASYEKLHPLLAPISSNTLGIYYMHWMFATAFSVYFGGLFSAYYGLLFNTLRSFGLVIICALLSSLIKKTPIIKEIL